MLTMMSKYLKSTFKSGKHDILDEIYYELDHLNCKINKVHMNQNKENSLEFINELKVKSFIQT